MTIWITCWVRRGLSVGLSPASPLSAHGLRKAGATIAADNGATSHQLMAIFGWTTIKQAEIYTKKGRSEAACRRRNAASGPRPFQSRRATSPDGQR